MAKVTGRSSRSDEGRAPLVESLESRTLLSGVDPGLPGVWATGTPLNAAVGASAFPLSSVPQLSSRPAAPVSIFLEFRGVGATTWNSLSVPEIPAYDRDGDTASFSQSELDSMREIWSRVSEKYSPFNVNVTTVDPGTYTANQIARVVVGGDGKWINGGTYGGYAQLGGFGSDVENANSAWVFSNNLAVSDHGVPKYVAEAAAHEAGHLFGLYHQSAYNELGQKVDEYNRGDDLKAPLMGTSYYSQRGVWWRSQVGTNTIQADITTMMVGGLTLRADDHGGTRALADRLNVLGAELSGEGVIERITDADVFAFTSTGGAVTLTGNVAPYGAMLDLAMSLADASGNLIASADTASLGETITADLAPGEYYLTITSHGNYGDIGQYSITGFVPEPGTVAVLVLGLSVVLRRRTERYRAGRRDATGG